MRPLIISLAPYALREWLFAKWYRAGAESHPQMFEDAALAFAPDVRMRLLPSDVAHGRIAYTGIYELSLTRRIVNLARDGGLMVDVGANFGYFSLLWAGNGRRNHSVAYEASPRNVAVLRANIERNRFGHKIELRACAVGWEAGSASFSPGPEEQTGWGGLAAGPADKGDVEVRVVALDDEFAGCPQIDVLKIDIEGADTWALYGAQRLFREQRIRHVFFEQNATRMRALGIRESEARDFLLAHGYTVTVISDEPGLREYHAHVV